MTHQRRILLADIGGTNARFVLMDRSGHTVSAANLLVADYGSVEAAISEFLRPHAGAKPEAAAVAVAGPVDGQRCVMTNCSWVIDAAHLTSAFSLRDALVLNDFEALAWSLPQLSGPDIQQIGPGTGCNSAPMVVLGPGTGLGVGAFLRPSGGGTVVPGEGGHVTLAGANAREDAILASIRDRFGHASAERVLSGAGLEALHVAIAQIDGQTGPSLAAPDITRLALQGSCRICVEVVQTFNALLGSLAGNLALTFGARGGVYIAGGIPPRLLPLLKRSTFRQRFEAKGRFQEWLAKVPTSVVVRPDAAMLGLAGNAAAAGWLETASA